MDHPIKPIDQIRREAREAAKTYADVNDACPYPFHTDAARIFREEFKAERAAQVPLERRS